MSGSASTDFVLSLPAYAGHLARGRRRGMRPPTRAELAGGTNDCSWGLDYQPIVYATDSWAVAKWWRRHNMAAVVIEPGPLYDFKWARGWIVRVLTRAPFTGVAGWIKEQGADLVLHECSPERVDEIEALARV